MRQAAPVPGQQVPVDHPGQRGPGRLLGHPDPAEHLDDARGADGRAGTQQVDAEKGEHQRLRPGSAAARRSPGPAAGSCHLARVRDDVGHVIDRGQMLAYCQGT